MYDTVLLPTDGSPAIETVVEHARDVVVRRDAALEASSNDRFPPLTTDSRIPND